MNDQADLFADFPAVSKEEWLAKVERDLKGRAVAELDWQLDEDITLSPFFHPDDLEAWPTPFTGGRLTNDWATGEYIDVEDVARANREALEGLNGGVNAPLFRLQHPLREEELKALLEGIDLGIVSVHFGQYFIDKKPAGLFDQFRSLLERRGIDGGTVTGSLDFDPILDWSDPPFDKLAEVLKTCAMEMPGFHGLQVNARRFHSGSERTALELGYAIAKGSEYLAQLAERGLDPALVNRHLQFSIDIGGIFFVEIAKLRALRLLWANVLRGYGVDKPEAPYIAAHIAPETQTEDPNTNMIQAATQALAAVTGGVDVLYVLPANASVEDHSTSFTRRIARNVQHILRLESHLDRVIDPAAGSYYVEKLTHMLAEKAWWKFQEIEGKGGYLGS